MELDEQLSSSLLEQVDETNRTDVKRRMADCMGDGDIAIEDLVSQYLEAAPGSAVRAGIDGAVEALTGFELRVFLQELADDLNLCEEG